MAAIALVALVASPLLEGYATAVRTACDVLRTLLEDDGAFNLAFPRLQRLLQLRALFRRQVDNGGKDLFDPRLLRHLPFPSPQKGQVESPSSRVITNTKHGQSRFFFEERRRGGTCRVVGCRPRRQADRTGRGTTALKDGPGNRGAPPQYRSSGSTSSDQRTRRASGNAYSCGMAASSRRCSRRRSGDDRTSCTR